MAGGFYGADIASLRTLAQQFDTAATRLAGLTSTLTTNVNATHAWQGPDAEGFRSDWNGTYTSTLKAAIRALSAGSADLLRNADEQNTASTDGVGGAGGSGSGGPGGTGSGSTPGTGPGSGTPSVTLPGGIHITPDKVTWGTTGPIKGDGAAGGGSLYIQNGEGHANAGTTYGPNGATDHSATAGWGWGVGGEAHGNFRSGDIVGSGSVDEFYGVKGDSGAHAGVTKDGQYYANADASGMVGAEANATGDVKLNEFSSLGGNVNALAGAAVDANAGGTIGPQGAGVNAGGEAFAGAKVGADGTITVGGISEKVGYEVSTGIGAHANVDADVTWDKVQLGWDAGVTFGIGGGFSQELSFSPKDIVKNVGDVFGF
ncbi:hypothetical protein B7R54_00215 [Subtercola boreus]|uniref:WXG100 family type VII secretion target n=1 Tax=Subtercola boreus TaxID=120213 RepID=A0A3E0VG14_9MICO|nr:hypothetical protein [Subtercola boreus]RFA07807.1 hypothetical protein B7R54_00215 [Subtercola boreus]TQL55346.1 hypothetical protein FB464_2909 [Subtercola boreus]